MERILTEKNRKLIIAGISPVLLVIILFVILGGNDGDEDIPIAIVRRESFEIKVDTVGTLDVASSQVVCSQVKGDKGKIIYLVEEGTSVNAEDILVRLDPSFFEEEERKYSTKVRESEANVSAWKQAVEWEKVQSEKEVKIAGYNVDIAKLDLKKLEKGDGPLDMARLEGLMLEAKRTYEDSKSYTTELQKLAKQGFSNITELSQAESKTEENRKKYEAAKLQFESYRDYILPAKLETARVKVERSKMELEQTKKSVGFKVGKTISSFKSAEERLKSAAASLEIAGQELKKTTITAPQPGLVVLREEFRHGERRKPRVGDTALQNQPLLYLPDISSMIVKTRVREVDLYKVATGDGVNVKVDSYPGKVYSGHVESIGIMAQERHEFQSGEKYFQVVVALDDSDERLRPGMTARVEILSGYVEDALTVPILALFEEEGRTVCFVDIRQSYEMREVITGRQNEELVEIKDGLKPGEKVCLIPPPGTAGVTTILLK